MAELNSQKMALIHEHEVIRAEIRLLINSTADLVHLKASSAGAWTGSRPDEVRDYQWRLRNLRDGISRHIELDESLVTLLQLGGLGDKLAQEHRAIRTLVDEMVRLADDAANNPGDEERLAEFRSALSRRLVTIRELIDVHTATEDALLRPA